MRAIADLTLEEIQATLERLPFQVALLVWDVVSGKVTRRTIELARLTAKQGPELYQEHEVVRVLAAGNPDTLDSLTEIAWEGIVSELFEGEGRP